MTYNVSDRLNKYTQTSEYKEHTFHFGMYLALTSLAGTITFIFSNTAIWITPLNMAVASFLIFLTGIYKKEDKRTFVLFYTHGTQKKEIIKSLIFGTILILLVNKTYKFTYIANNWLQNNIINNYNIITHLISSFMSSVMHFFIVFLTLLTLTMGISFFVKPIALFIVKQVMKYRKII